MLFCAIGMVLSTLCTTYLAFVPLVPLVSGPLRPLPSSRPQVPCHLIPDVRSLRPCANCTFRPSQASTLVEHPKNGALCPQVHLPHGPTTPACSHAIVAKSGTLCATRSTCHTQINNSWCHSQPHSPMVQNWHATYTSGMPCLSRHPPHCHQHPLVLTPDPGPDLTRPFDFFTVPLNLA